MFEEIGPGPISWLYRSSSTDKKFEISAKNTDCGHVLHFNPFRNCAKRAIQR